MAMTKVANISCPTSSDEHVCQVTADPRDYAFEGGRARIYIPCKYRLTKFMTTFRNSQSKMRFCEFEAFSFGKIVDGHNFVGGLEVKVFVYDSETQQAYQRDFLKFEIDSVSYEIISNKILVLNHK